MVIGTIVSACADGCDLTFVKNGRFEHVSNYCLLIYILLFASAKHMVLCPLRLGSIEIQFFSFSSFRIRICYARNGLECLAIVVLCNFAE